MPDKAGILGITGTQLKQVRGHADRQFITFFLGNIKKMKVSRLFIDDLSSTIRSLDHRKIHVRGELFDLLCFRAEGEKVEFPVSIRTKINLVSNPHGISVVAAALWLRNLLYGVIVK